METNRESEEVMVLRASMQTHGRWAKLLQRAATLPGRPRERIVALLAVEEALIRTRSRLSSSPPARHAESSGTHETSERDAHPKTPEKGLVSLLVDVVLDAVRGGDLRFPNAERPEELACSACVLALGIGLLMDTTQFADMLGVGADGFQATRAAVNELLDAQGWQPLSTEWDYDKTQERTRRELFEDGSISRQHAGAPGT
jgi:hypothetical protein